MDNNGFFGKIWGAVKKFFVEDFRVNFNEKMEELDSNGGRRLGLTVVAACCVMLLSCLAVFFLTVKGAEQVLVPNVLHKEWSTAEIEMQQKELYAKIQMRYTDDPNDEGKVIAQSPKGGAIVKAGTRVTLTISRGTAIQAIENYIGKNFDDVRADIVSMFAGSARPLIEIGEPIYKADNAELGTILEQDPPEGTQISGPTKLNLIVSRGPTYDNTKVPRVVNKSIEDMYRMMSTSKVIFDYSSVAASGDNEYGKIVAQDEITEEYVANYTRIGVTMALPKNGRATINKTEYKYGIFEAQLHEYPFAVDMELIAAGNDGSRETLVSFKHTGGSVTVPYMLEDEVTLYLTVAGKEAARFKVN